MDDSEGDRIFVGDNEVLKTETVSEYRSRQTQTWIDKLESEYPQFEVYGDPRSHYEKISRGQGNNYYVYQNDLENGRYLLHDGADVMDRANEENGTVSWKVVILGNKAPVGTTLVIALFKPENLPDVDRVQLPALAYSSFDDAQTHLCEEFGECVGLSEESGMEKSWLEFHPSKDLTQSNFMKNFVGIYADGKKLDVLVDEFEVVVLDEGDREEQEEPENTRSRSMGRSKSRLQKTNPSKSLEEVTGGLRTKASYTHTLQQILNVITISKGTMPVGSFKYNVHKYPGDIDIFEQYDACCSVEEAAASAAYEIQQILVRVKAAPNTYLGDFKAGEDRRYSLDLGKWEVFQEELGAKGENGEDGSESQENKKQGIQGESQEARLMGYDSGRVERDIRNLRKQRLITEDELQGLLSLAVDNPDRHEWDELSDEIRKHQVLRWNSQEIAEGRKVLPGAEIITLEQAITQHTLVKIDLWSRVNGKYMEVTNFFMISAFKNCQKEVSKSRNIVDEIAKDGNEATVEKTRTRPVHKCRGTKIETLTQELPDYEKSISKDVRFYSSPEHRKTLKALKRLWSLALFREDLELAGRISPLFASNASALHQMNGEAEVLAMMFVRLPDPPLAQMMEQIDGFKPRIDQLSNSLEDNEVLYRLIDSVIEPYYQGYSSPGNTGLGYSSFEEAAELLDEFQKKLGGMVEDLIFGQARAAGLEDPASFL